MNLQRLAEAGACDVAVQAYPAAPVTALETVKPISMCEPQPGVFVFDMGQNFAGIVQLEVSCDSTVVTCLHCIHAAAKQTLAAASANLCVGC